MRNYWYIPAAMLVVLAIVGFFAGWLQLALRPDEWGIVFTRAGGFEKTPVDPAGFTWRWQRLLPRSLSLSRIRLATDSADVEVRASLPSADAHVIRFLFLATAEKLTHKDLQTLDLLERLPTVE